jgi:hypothetical protein
MDESAVCDCVRRRERIAIVAERALVPSDGLTEVDGAEMLIRDVPSTMSFAAGRSLLIRAMMAGKAVEETSTPVAAYPEDQHGCLWTNS